MAKGCAARVTAYLLLENLESRALLSASIVATLGGNGLPTGSTLLAAPVVVKLSPGASRTLLGPVVAPSLPPRIPGEQIPLARAANPNTDPPMPVIDLGHLPTFSAYNWHTQVINGVLNVWAPNPGDYVNTYTVTSTAALFGPSGTPALTDIHQGPLADCYLLSAVGSLARTHPDLVQSDIQNDPGGGWAVTFQIYSLSVGGYTPIEIHTDNTLSYSQTQSVNGDVWPLVLEKAFAAFRTWNGSTSTNTMASINWGSPTQALTQLGVSNNQIYTGMMNDQTFYNTLQSALAAGEPVLFQTANNASTMVAAHVYTITGISTDAGGTRWVTTYNPWGFYDTRTEIELRANGIGTLVIGAI